MPTTNILQIYIQIDTTNTTNTNRHVVAALKSIFNIRKRCCEAITKETGGGREREAGKERRGA